MGYYESKKVNIIPGRAGSVFGPSKLLLDGGGFNKNSSFNFNYPVFLAKISSIIVKFYLKIYI